MFEIFKVHGASTLVSSLLVAALAACGSSGTGAPDQITLSNASMAGSTGAQQDVPSGTQLPGKNQGSDAGNGSGSGSDNGNGSSKPPEQSGNDPRPPVSPALAPVCSLESCAAASPSWYAGSGVGIWHYKNQGGSEITLPIGIGGLLADSLVTLVMANESGTVLALPLGQKAVPPTTRPLAPNRPQSICQENETGWLLPGPYRESADAAVQTVAQMHCTSKAASILAHDGRSIDFWVENGQQTSGRISAALIDTLGRRFALELQNNVYDTVTAITGAPWGNARNDLYIGDPDNGAALPPLPLNIVFVDRLADHMAPGDYQVQLNRDNLLRKATLAGTDISAQKLSIFIDSAALYNNPSLLTSDESDQQMLDAVATTEVLKSQLARELTRLAVTYQRTVRLSARYTLPPWLDDLVASMMQYTVDSKLGSVRTGTFGTLTHQGVALPLANWFKGTPSCDVLLRPASAPPDGFCPSDSSSVAFAVYLMNQHGVGLLRRIIAEQGVTGEIDYLAMLDQRLQQAGAPGLSGSLWRHGTSLALTGKQPLPPLFGFPANADSVYPLAAQNLASLSQAEQLPLERSEIAASIAPYGFVAARRPAGATSYIESLAVPPGASVTVVIQPRP
ncbi:MAG: M30 family zinc metallopeptidase [Janthinobacterium lividum]